MSAAPFVHVRVAADAAADALAMHPDFQVLRRVDPIRRTMDGGVRQGMLAGVALDVETTGLDYRSDRIIELALRRFWCEPGGCIAEAGGTHSWLEDPGRPISPEIERLTGIAAADVRGRSITEPIAVSILRDADFVVSHNAAFDRPFVEARLPDVAGAAWVCSCADVDWRGLGFEGRSLSHLLLQMGWFYGAHRAEGDVEALLRLLDHPLGTGGTVMASAIARATMPTWIVTADGARFETKDALKARGYRWNANARAWSRQVAEADLEAEVGWAEREVYERRRQPFVRKVTWRERYAAGDR